MSLKIKKLDQAATGISISEFEKKESLWTLIFESYNNRDAKYKNFKRLSELFRLSLFHNFPPFFLFFIVAVRLLAATISSKLIFFQQLEEFYRERASLHIFFDLSYFKLI